MALAPKTIASLRLMAVLLLMLALSGCLTRTRKVQQRMSTATLKEATLAQLVDRINLEARKIQTLNATVDIATAAGGAKKGKITEYQEIRGYILLRKPETLRMIGLVPVVRNRLFDMVSDGEQFKLWVPPRNKFIVGRNDFVRPSKQPLENLRPHHILDALLLHEIDPKNEIAVLEAGTEIVKDKDKKDVQQATYEVVVVSRDAAGEWHMARRIIFSRVDLLPHRQIVYDKTGNIATIASYENFQTFDQVLFPSVVQIERPQEEYSIGLKMVKLRVNEPLRDDQFALEKPNDAELVRLAEANGATPKPADAPPQGAASQKRQ